MSKAIFDKIKDNFDDLYKEVSSELREITFKLLYDISEINEIFKDIIEKDLYRKRLIVNISSSYLENSFDIILRKKYLPDNEIAEKLLDKIRKTGMSGFNILIMNSLIQMFDEDVARKIQSMFDKKGHGKQLKENIIVYNKLRNECSHIGDLSKSDLSKVGYDIIYGYIIQGMIVVYALYNLLTNEREENKLKDIFDKFEYQLLDE